MAIQEFKERLLVFLVVVDINASREASCRYMSGFSIRSDHQYGSLAAFIFLTLAIGLTIGWLTAPGEWYAALTKPSFNPPDWIFGPVWTFLYLLIAVAGWLVWKKSRNSAAMRMWFAQMALNWVWSPAFFGLQAPRLALAVIVLLLLATIIFMVAAYSIDKKSTWLFVPYVLWVSFAAALNAAIVILN